MMEYTKGDWIVRYMDESNIESGFFVQAPRTNPSDPYDIEILGDDDGNGLYPIEQRLADAKLIASAPDLLKALKDSLQMLEQTLKYRESNKLTMGNTFLKCAIENSKNAIKKATE